MLGANGVSRQRTGAFIGAVFLARRIMPRRGALATLLAIIMVVSVRIWLYRLTRSGVTVPAMRGHKATGLAQGPSRALVRLQYRHPSRAVGTPTPCLLAAVRSP